MFNVLILIVIFMVSEIFTDFYAGRIKPGKYEYPKLNGWMLVEEAKQLCEKDLACGGFTFKGSYKTLTRPMEMYFFILFHKILVWIISIGQHMKLIGNM